MCYTHQVDLTIILLISSQVNSTPYQCLANQKVNLYGSVVYAVPSAGATPRQIHWMDLAIRCIELHHTAIITQKLCRCYAVVTSFQLSCRKLCINQSFLSAWWFKCFFVEEGPFWLCTDRVLNHHMASPEPKGSPESLFSDDDDLNTGDASVSDSVEDNGARSSGIPSGTVLAFSTVGYGTTTPAGSGGDLPVFPSIIHNMHRDTFSFQSVHRHEHVTARHIHHDMVLRVAHHHHYRAHHHVHLSCTSGSCLGGEPSPESEPLSSDKSEFVGNLQAVMESASPTSRKKRRHRWDFIE